MDGYKFIKIVQRRSKIVMVSKDGQKWISLNDALGILAEGTDGFVATLKLADVSLVSFEKKS